MEESGLTKELVKIAGLPENVFELLEKLKELERKGPKSGRACWIDGEECPYGRPRGQFLFRPKQFCRPGVGPGTGCQKINDSEDLTVMKEEALRQEWQEQLSEIVKETTLKLSCEVRTVAESEENKQKKGVFKLAADLIEEREKSERDTQIVGIIREDDLASALEKLEIAID